MHEVRASDSQLARAARNGSRSAFAALAERYQQRLFRFLRMRTGRVEDAEELLQETLLRSWLQIARYDPDRAFAAWLFTLGARLAASFERRRRLPRAGAAELDEVAAPSDRETALEQREARDNLWDLAQRVLPADARTALWLFYAEELSAAAIGAVLGKREDAVRAMLYRARATLGIHLAGALTCATRPT